jgi:predicted RNA binding protein YcfA (HicA-like mRNA interferase family)
VAKKNKKASNLNRGPFTAADIDRALRADGWTAKAGGKHQVYRHPEKSGKIPASSKWRHVKAGDWLFRSLARGAGLTKKQLLRLLNGLDP